MYDANMGKQALSSLPAARATVLRNCVLHSVGAGEGMGEEISLHFGSVWLQGRTLRVFLYVCVCAKVDISILLSLSNLMEHFG